MYIEYLTVLMHLLIIYHFMMANRRKKTVTDLQFHYHQKIVSSMQIVDI